MTEAKAFPFLGGTLLSYSSEFSEFGNKNQDSIAFFELSDELWSTSSCRRNWGLKRWRSSITTIIDTFLKELKNPSEMSLFSRAFEICQEANKNVKSLNIGAGATLSVVFIEKSKALLINVGDSPIYHFSATGQLKNQSINFSVGGFMEKVQLRPSDSPKRLIEESNHLITYIGAEFPSLFSMEPIELNPRDIILLM